jgi:hypothetical protein
MNFIFDWIFPIVLVLVGVLIFFPRSIFLFNSGLRFYFEDNTKLSITKIHKAKVAQISDKLKALGFINLGIKVEKLPLWGGKIRQLSFASINDSAFATILNDIINSRLQAKFCTISSIRHYHAPTFQIGVQPD